MAFLIDSLREKIGGEEEPGFDDMNYLVGNTSGLDIGQVPAPIDQRIGRMAQIGGSIMEIQITNPATFQIDRREMLNVINQIDFERITLHGDPNIGFTAAYATRAQGVAGYNIVHRYMKRYLEQMAAFKYEIDSREDLDFKMGYVNMHASNEQIPPLEERLASDVSVDPFGEQTIDFDDRENRRANIWRNEEFLEKLFDYWFLEVVDNPYQYYEPTTRLGVFSDADENFRESWREAKEDVADEFYANQVDNKIGILQTAARVDQGVETEFLDFCEKQKVNSFEIGLQQRTAEGVEPVDSVQINNIADLRRFNLFGSINQLARDLHSVERGRVQIQGQRIEVSEKGQQTIKDNFNNIKNSIRKIVDALWEEELSVEAKERSLANNEDIQQTQIFQKAEGRIENEARNTFAHSSWEVRQEILNQLATGRERDEFLKESSIFFQIMPAWMQAADKEYENHPSFDGPRFIWDKIVGETFDSFDNFQEWLQKSRENQLNVIAAVGAAYIWGHCTQVENRFETQAFEGALVDIEMPELRNGSFGDYTWAEWMNKFGLKLNLEAMYGDPGQLRRVWRPKDIAVTCHAINKTAKRQSENWSEEYKGAIAKFTIDMEHTASYGVDPYQEIELMIDREKEIASETGGNSEKPLADIMKTYHLTKPGWEQQSGHRHGPFARGDETLYKWLYKMVDNGFARNPDDTAVVMFEVGGEYREEMYVIRVALDMIQMGIKPEDLDPNKVPIEGDYENPKQALMARFFGLDKPKFNREWTKIEEHAFDPLSDLLEAESFDHTYSGRAAMENNKLQEWSQEEYK